MAINNALEPFTKNMGMATIRAPHKIKSSRMISFIPVDELWQYPEILMYSLFFVYKYNVGVIKICGCVATVSYFTQR